MKRFTFAHFRVDENNREAFEICHQVADFQPVFPQPIVLVGESGSGKTHLLYSIVNRIRASASTAGLAYITAYDFPDKVRALVDDPTPIQRVRKAILLVDQLEEFVELTDELEEVIRLFLQCQHAVVLGTTIHPRRLTNLPRELIELIMQGKIVVIRGKPAEVKEHAPLQPEAEEQTVLELTRAREEIQELRHMIEQVRLDNDRRMEREAEELESGLSTVAEKIDGLHQEWREYISEIHRVLGDIRHLSEEKIEDTLASSDILEDLQELRAQIQRLSIEREAIAAERDGLRLRIETLEHYRHSLLLENEKLKQELSQLKNPYILEKQAEEISEE